MEITKLTGNVHLVADTQQKSEKFKSRELVLKTGGDYPQFILVQFTQDKCELLNNLKIGDFVSVNYNIRGREWANPTTGEIKYFNSIEGWSIELKSNMSNDEKTFGAINKKSVLDNDNDDLPF
jgi:hypothetical protein